MKSEARVKRVLYFNVSYVWTYECNSAHGGHRCQCHCGYGHVILHTCMPADSTSSLPAAECSDYSTDAIKGTVELELLCVRRSPDVHACRVPRTGFTQSIFFNQRVTEEHLMHGILLVLGWPAT